MIYRKYMFGHSYARHGVRRASGLVNMWRLQVLSVLEGHGGSGPSPCTSPYASLPLAVDSYPLSYLHIPGKFQCFSEFCEPL